MSTVRRPLLLLPKRGLGGNQELALRWVQCLLTAGGEPSVATLTDGSGIESPAVIELTKLIGEIPSLGHTGARNIPRTIRRLRATIDRTRSDVVHGFYPLAENYSRIATFGTSVPTVWTMVSVLTQSAGGPAHRLASQARRLAPGIFADAWIAVGSTVASRAIAAGWPAQRLHVVTPGLDLSRFEGKVTPAALPVESGEVPIVAIGRLFPSKGFADLIRALCHLPSETVLIVVGRGSQETSLRQLAAEIGVEDRVRFLGQRDDIPAILSASAVYVTATRVEGLVGYSTLEAVAAGVPVVASDIPEIREVFDDTCVRYADPSEPEQIAAQVADALANPNDGRIEHAQAELRRRFDQKQIGHDLMEVYRTAAESPWV